MQTLNLGKTIAPPRFILFTLIFAAGLAVAIPLLDWGRGAMVAFDVAAAVFLVAVSPLLRRGQARQMREAAEANDANRVGLLAITAVVMSVVLLSVVGEMNAKDAPGKALIVATLALSWLFSNTIYALHYAHLFYLPGDDGKDYGGLEFPQCPEPDYWDMIYFAFTLGMTFQTSDVEIQSRQFRRVALGQCLAAFVFNIGVLAFTINVLGS